MKPRALFVALALAPTLLASCARSTIDGPPELRPGRDECAHCGMLLSEDRCAAAMLLDRAGSRVQAVFDDLGCLLDYERELEGQAGDRVVRRYVRDYDGRTWLDAEQAVIIAAPPTALVTPMGSGLVAFASQPAAAKARERAGGEITDFAGAAARRREAKAAPHPGSGHGR